MWLLQIQISLKIKWKRPTGKWFRRKSRIKWRKNFFSEIILWHCLINSCEKWNGTWNTILFEEFVSHHFYISSILYCFRSVNYLLCSSSSIVDQPKTKNIYVMLIDNKICSLIFYHLLKNKEPFIYHLLCKKKKR